MERPQNPGRLEHDLSRIGIVQRDERRWSTPTHEIRRLDWRDISELNRVVELQDKVWRMGAINLIPENLLAVVEETGGDVLAAYKADGNPEGFVLTLATNQPEKLFLHMIGVVGEKQSLNVGKQLMLLEGAIARSRGVKEIQWTYDPLMGGNSQLYISKLHATPFKYTVNKYGIVKNDDTKGESRYKNVETDRFTVRWRVGNESVWNSVTNNTPENIAAIDVPMWDGDGNVPDTFRVGVPYDFTKLSTDEMMDARMAIRKIALKTLDFDDISNRDDKKGSHEITGFLRDLNKLTNIYTFSKKI